LIPTTQDEIKNNIIGAGNAKAIIVKILPAFTNPKYGNTLS
jgi:hypothetical protein